MINHDAESGMKIKLGRVVHDKGAKETEHQHEQEQEQEEEEEEEREEEKENENEKDEMQRDQRRRTRQDIWTAFFNPWKLPATSIMTR